MVLSPFELLNKAVGAVPAVRFALGIAGLGATVSIVAGINLDLRVAVFGTILMIGLMFILLIFSTLVGNAGQSLFIPALVATWFFLLLTITASSL